MDRIQQAFENTKKRAALIPFLNAGDPHFDASLQACLGAINAGADVLEIGVPYSDPLADGPVIQASALRSLQSGFALPRAFDLTAELRRRSQSALVLFTYVNPVIQYGLDAFFRDAKSAGADGAIIPDLPFEESEEVRTTADRHGIALVPLVAPTSGEHRIAAICQQARGFVYCVSSLGVTGERARMSERVQEIVRIARNNTTLPVAVGFGVSSPEQASAIATYADGVIVGSALIRRLESALQENADPSADHATVVARAVAHFTGQLAVAMKL